MLGSPSPFSFILCKCGPPACTAWSKYYVNMKQILWVSEAKRLTCCGSFKRNGKYFYLQTRPLQYYCLFLTRCYCNYSIYIITIRRTIQCNRHDLAAWLTLRQARPQWLPFYLHSKLCKNDTSAAYQKHRMRWNWYFYYECLLKVLNYAIFSWRNLHDVIRVAFT